MISKFIPASVTRAVGRTALKVDANSPKLLFVGGVVGVVGATVLACKATLKIEEVLLDHEKTMIGIKVMQHEQYSEQDRQHDKIYLYARTTAQITKMYAPSIILGSVSIAALTKSHNILQSRNAALSAAYAGLDATFKKYRSRVQTELGEDKEKEVYLDAQTVAVSSKDGKGVKLKKFAGPNGGSPYAQYYSADTNRNFVEGSPEANIMVLRQRENYLNDKLRMRGHLFLNEALEELGFDHTEAGATLGWLFKPGDADHVGDSYVNFGIWEDDARDRLADLVIYGEGIFIDFNVDGEIHRKLAEVEPIWAHSDKALRRKRRS